VEDTVGTWVDSNYGRPWDVLEHDERGRPRFEALRAKVAHYAAIDPVLSLATAREMVEHHPERAESWRALIAFERLLVPEEAMDSLRAEHRQRFAEFDRRYGGGGFLLMRLIESVTSHFATPAREQEVDAFFQAHPVPSAARTVQQAMRQASMIAKSAGERIDRTPASAVTSSNESKAELSHRRNGLWDDALIRPRQMKAAHHGIERNVRETRTGML
jgi:hypothetical protein